MKVFRKPTKAAPGFRLEVTPRLTVAWKKRGLVFRLDDAWLTANQFLAPAGGWPRDWFARLFTPELFTGDGTTVARLTEGGPVAVDPESLVGRTAADDLVEDATGEIHAEPGRRVPSVQALLAVRGEFALLDEGEVKKWPWLVASLGAPYASPERTDAIDPWGIELGPDGRAELNALIDATRTEAWLTPADAYGLLRLCREGATE